MLGALYQINNISSSIIFVDGIWTSCDSLDCIDKCLRNKQSRHLVCLRVFAKMINLALIWAAPFHTLGDQDGIKGQGLKREFSSTNSSPLSLHCYVSYSTTLFSLPQWTETSETVRQSKSDLFYMCLAGIRHSDSKSNEHLKHPCLHAMSVLISSTLPWFGKRVLNGWRITWKN